MGCRTPDKNGACIRIDPEAGDITIKDVYCHDSEDGVLGGPQQGSVTMKTPFERKRLAVGVESISTLETSFL